VFLRRAALPLESVPLCPDVPFYTIQLSERHTDMRRGFSRGVPRLQTREDLAPSPATIPSGTGPPLPSRGIYIEM